MVEDIKSKDKMDALKKKLPLFIIFICILLFFVFELLALFIPTGWEADSGMYVAVGTYLNKGYILYKNLWDIKPPSIYYVTSFSLHFFPFNLFPLELLVVLLNVSELGITILLAKKWFLNKYNDKTFCYIFAFLLFLYVFFRINEFNTEAFFTLTSVLSIYMIYKFNEEKSLVKFAFAGFIIGLGVTFKALAAFDEFAFIFTLLIISLQKWNQWHDRSLFLKGLQKTIVYSLASLIPFLIYLMLSISQHALSDFIGAVFLENRAYIAQFQSSILGISSLYFNSIIALILLIVNTYLFFKKKIFMPYEFFVFNWLTFSILAGLLSNRTSTNYFIQAIVPICFGAIIILKRFPLTYFFIYICLLVAIVCYSNRTDSLSYTLKVHYGGEASIYLHTLEYMLHGISKEQYLESFKDTVPDTFLILHYINSFNANSYLYVYSHNAWIYAGSKMMLSCRYINAEDLPLVHNAYKDAIACLNRKKPKIIVDYGSLATSRSFPALHIYEHENYVLVETFANMEIKVYRRR